MGELTLARSPYVHYFVLHATQVKPCKGSFVGDGWITTRVDHPGLADWIAGTYRGSDCRGPVDAGFDVRPQ